MDRTENYNYDIFVAKTRNYDIFVAKIYDFALIDSFLRISTSYATLVQAHKYPCSQLIMRDNERQIGSQKRKNRAITADLHTLQWCIREC